MKQSDLVQALMGHIGNLRPAPGATNAELYDLRKAVVSSLRGGQPATEIGTSVSTQPIPSAVSLDLEYLASHQFGGGQRSWVARRDFGPSGIGTAGWARGMQPSQTFGPFLDELGQSHWFDVFLFPEPFRVTRGNQPLLILPIGTHKKPDEQSLVITQGTVWIRGNQLSASVPADAWVGIRVKGGSLGMPQASILVDKSLNLQVADSLNLQIELDPPSLAGPASGPGSEASHADAQLPETAQFSFGPLGVERIDVASSSLHVYGNSITLTHAVLPVVYEPALQMLLIGMEASATSIKISGPHSPLFKPAGSAPFEKAAWGLSVTFSQPDNLGTAAGSGSLVLVIKPRLTGSWVGLSEDEAALGKTFLSVDPSSLSVVSQATAHFGGKQTLGLWQSTAQSRHSAIDLQFPYPFSLWFMSHRDGTDGLAFQSHLSGCLDRPILVDGTSMPVDLQGSVVFLQKADETTVAIEAISQWQGDSRPLAVALTNGLLTITPPTRLFLNGKIGVEKQVESGTLVLASGIYQVLPILPDPYAANFEPRLRRDAPLGDAFLRAITTWPDPTHPSLQILLDTPDRGVPELLPEPNQTTTDPFEFRRLNSSNRYWLLDISSSADQLGLSLSIPTGEGVRPESRRLLVDDDLSMQFSGNQLYTMLLPQFQWEAVYNTRNIRTFDSEGPLLPSVEGEATDGGPAFVRTETARLIPMAPVPVAIEMVRAYTRDNATSEARFTLPFGMTAAASLQDERYVTPPDLRLLAVRFDDLTGARQISLTAGVETARVIEGNEVTTHRGPLLSGHAFQTRNFSGSGPDNTLGALRTSFNNTFNHRVPIQRIDFSGYGATIFSRWTPAGAIDVGITQVSFDGFNGRTSFERVQMVTLLWPCLGRLVRTIVLERQGSGSVVRWDSGWLSTTPGLFFHRNFRTIHKCVVDGMYDIREIRDTDQVIELTGATVQAVYYDADIAFSLIDGHSLLEAGQNSSGRVPSRRQLGFIQLVNYEPNQDFANTGVKPLTYEQFDELLQRVGPLGGPVDCKLRIGKSRQLTRVTQVNTARGGRTAPASPEFAITLIGAPVFTGSGAWSVVSVDTADKTVHPIDTKIGVPLIQRNGGAYRWADPEDLLHETQAKRDYALLLTHDTQRFLMQRPKIEINSANISSAVQPKVADPYSMLSSTGLFPRVDEVIKLSPGVELVAGTLSLAASKLNLGPGSLGLAQKPLVNLPAWDEIADFSKASLFVDSLDRWKIRLTNIQQKLQFKAVGEIMTVVHDFESVAGDLSKFLQPKLNFSPELQAVADVLDVLNSLKPDLPGGIGPFKLSASFSGTTFSLSAVADFKLATKDDDAVECGMGKVKGDLQVGAELSADISSRDIRGAVFLQITGSYQQQIFPFLYGGGLLRFLIRGDQTGKPTLELDACTIGSIGGTVIPGLIDLEATVKYGYFIQMKTKITPGLVVGMEGRAKLLSGLLGFKFGVEGRAVIDPQPLLNADDDERAIRLYGRIRVAGTVTLAWAIEKSKSFETDFDVDVNWKLALVIAKAGLLPVP